MNKTIQTLIVSSITILVAFASSPLSARNAKCLIEISGETFHDLCNFEPGPKGSFSLSQSRTVSSFLSYASIISVHIIGPGKAEVRGLTHDGINSRWGEANRSTQDGACWRGADFQICAW